MFHTLKLVHERILLKGYIKEWAVNITNYIIEEKSIGITELHLAGLDEALQIFITLLKVLHLPKISSEILSLARYCSWIDKTNVPLGFSKIKSTVLE